MFAQALAQLAVFVFEARQAQSILDGHEQLVGGERLFQKIERAKTGGFHGHFDVGLAGYENYGRLYTGFFQILEQLHAGFAGHDHIGKNQIEIFVAKKLDSTVCVIANGGLVAGEAKRARKRGQSVRIVVNKEEMSFAGQKWVL